MTTNSNKSMIVVDTIAIPSPLRSVCVPLASPIRAQEPHPQLPTMPGASFLQDGGTHKLSNMTIACSGHHRELHAGKLTIRGQAPDALTFEWRGGKRAVQDATNLSDDDVRTALVTMGFKSCESRDAVRLARSHVGDAAAAEQVLREALRELASRRRATPSSATRPPRAA